MRFRLGLIVAFVVAAIFAATAAAPSPETTTPTFYKDILPLLQNHCQSCHRPGEVAPMPLLKYQDDIARLDGTKVKALLDEVKSELRAAE